MFHWGGTFCLEEAKEKWNLQRKTVRSPSQLPSFPFVTRFSILRQTLRFILLRFPSLQGLNSISKFPGSIHSHSFVHHKPQRRRSQLIDVSTENAPITTQQSLSRRIFSPLMPRMDNPKPIFTSESDVRSMTQLVEHQHFDESDGERGDEKSGTEGKGGVVMSLWMQVTAEATQEGQENLKVPSRNDE
jgi:hypothetical protein